MEQETQSNQPKCALCKTRQLRKYYPVREDGTLSKLCFGCLSDEMEAEDKLYTEEIQAKSAVEKRRRYTNPIRYCFGCQTYLKKENFRIKLDGKFSRRCVTCEGPRVCMKCRSSKRVNHRVCDDCLNALAERDSQLYHLLHAVSQEIGREKAMSIFKAMKVNENILRRK